MHRAKLSNLEIPKIIRTKINRDFCKFTFRKVYSTKTFIIPVVLFSVTYNIPKFFELTTENVTVNANSTPCTRNLASNLTFVDLRPTWLRTNPHYVRIYILWMNLFFHIVGPFVVLVIMNLRIYKRIKDFEVILHFWSIPQFTDQLAIIHSAIHHFGKFNVRQFLHLGNVARRRICT